MATAYKLVYAGGFVAIGGAWTSVDLGSVDLESVHPRINWNDNLVFTVGETVESNDYTTTTAGGDDPGTIPVGFEARKTLAYLARWVLSPQFPRPWLKVVELSYDPDLDVLIESRQDKQWLLRAYVVAELTHDDLIAAA